MAAPIGNQNAAKAKQWSAAIERALERRGDPSINPDFPLERSAKMKGFDELADKFIASVALSDISFFREFGDRIDGKPAQEVHGANGGPLVVITAGKLDEAL